MAWASKKYAPISKLDWLKLPHCGHITVANRAMTILWETKEEKREKTGRKVGFKPRMEDTVR